MTKMGNKPPEDSKEAWNLFSHNSSKEINPGDFDFELLDSRTLRQ
jgi:hypothetical protein